MSDSECPPLEPITLLPQYPKTLPDLIEKMEHGGTVGDMVNLMAMTDPSTTPRLWKVCISDKVDFTTRAMSLRQFTKRYGTSSPHTIERLPSGLIAYTFLDEESFSEGASCCWPNVFLLNPESGIVTPNCIGDELYSAISWVQVFGSI